MKKILLIISAVVFSHGVFGQANVADARTFGLNQTVTVTAVATNGSELGSIRYMQDNTAGIAAYSTTALTGVNRGDSITVTGQIFDFSGLMEISPVTNVVNHGPAVIQPTPLLIPITSAGESLESQLVELQNVTFVQTGSFATGNSTVQITDGTNTLDVRINGSTNIAGTAIPTGPITLTGLVGQFNANYQIVPRDLNDIVPYVAPLYEINVLVEGVTVLHNGNYFVGNTTVTNFTIENYGTQDLIVSGAAITGANAADFSTNLATATIAGGTSQSFVLNFNPTITGSLFADLEISSNDADENPYIIHFEGVGTDNLATEPTANPSNLIFPLLEAYTLGGQYTAGTGASNYIVLWKNGSPVTEIPVDGTTYQRGDIIGGAKVAYIGSGTSFTPRGIIANQDYNFAVFGFNGQGGFENYLTTSPATGNVTSLGENINGYYGTINSSSPTLVTDLNALINPHNVVSYFMYRQTMMETFEAKDTVNGDSYVTCAYTGENKVYSGNFNWTNTGYSREHTYAHSWMPSWPADNPEQPEYNDQHNLYPTNLAEANSPRSNLPFGVIDGQIVQQYLDGKKGYMGNQLVYEPRDQQKGNVARAIFYMTVAYGFPLTGDVDADKQLESILRDWHFNDLPDDYEIARHEYIFSIQGNRNPFIDSVDFVCYVNFDNNVYEPLGCLASVEELTQANMVVFPVPSNDMVYIQVNGQEITSYEIVDMYGKVVINKDNLHIGTVELNSNLLERGSYIVRVTTEKGSAQKKLIIQ